jgi:IS1 family transposase
MNRLSLQDRAKILSCLVEGSSIRSTARITNTDKKTVLRLLADVGAACKAYHDKHVRNVPSRRVQCDEIWSFCYSKQANVPPELQGDFGRGDVWTWTALDADSKLIISYLLDNRDEEAAHSFMRDLQPRLKHRVQLTTDGYRPYLTAVDDAFGGDVDYAMLVKLYRADRAAKAERRYSPAECCGARKVRLAGSPFKKDISTSYVERQNLTMRMNMRRFTRLTNAFSKKVENHMHALSIYFLHYNFGRIHQTLRVTPAMESGLSDHVWSLEEIAALADAPQKAPAILEI